MSRRSRASAAATLLALSLAICPTVQAKDKSRTDYPTWAGAYEPKDQDERGFWHEMDELEQKLKFSKNIYKDAALQKYVEGVLCQAVGRDRCSAARIYLVREASFNAGMYPNGMMLVHTGLMLRMRNEAELASVLGHEFGHFEERHTLEGFKRTRTGSDIVMWAAIVAGINLSNAFNMSYIAFNRDQEKEADMVGASYLRASPYPMRAAADVWVRLIDEDDARAEERKRGKRGRHTEFFDSHPAPLVRAAYLSRAAEAAADEGDFGVNSYVARTEPHLLTFFDDQLQRNDFAASKYILEQVAGDSWLPVHYVMQGELYRKRGMPRDLVTAEESYRKAIDLGFKRPEAWRGLGLALLRSDRRDEGREALRTYLSTAPDAADKAMISMMIGG